MNPKTCRSRQDLELLGLGDDAYGDCCMHGEPIDCSGISVDEIQRLFEEARRFLIKRTAEATAGEIAMFAGLLTLGIGSVVAVVNTNVKINALKREFQVNSESFKTSVFRLYSIGYRVTTVHSSQNFRLEQTGERLIGRIF